MSNNGIKVDGGEFWVVEVRDGADIEAWVYSSEDAAIEELYSKTEVLIDTW